MSQKTLYNRYEFDPEKDKLGKGAFAEVYKAYDKERERTVALKIYGGERNERYDIIGEINKMEDIMHPHLVRYYDARKLREDMPYGPRNSQVGVMEYANAGTYILAYSAFIGIMIFPSFFNLLEGC